MSLSADDALAIDALSTEPGAPADGPIPGASGFHVRLDNFEGPFDLLLSLISRRQLDVTEVALSQVTDEFLTYLGAAPTGISGQATEFLVVAATLLDLKTARLLPSAEVEDEEDLALLEARDLLFARLLQYRAYKLAAAYLAELERAQSQRHGRSVELEAQFTALLPEVVIGVSARPVRRARRRALTPQAGADRGTRTRTCAAGQRARAHGDLPRAPASFGVGDLPVADRRLRLDARGRGPFPWPARALPRWRGRLRSGGGARLSCGCAGPDR